ncbi:Protein FAM162B [Collichthys lucidus]|uniref:Protein FAM162B n=1 Tax=Collichthys lucidus TaxID=240159 RepID=A0A4V6AT94_COLLU|nr:Protein FAM162B [Collichthys lucidus]
MNLVRSRISIGNLIGQRCRQVTETWSHRGMCNKPPEAKAEPPTPPAQAPRAAFRIPGQRPSNFDKKMLVWSGRFKTVDQIPELVSFEMIDAARNKVRVKACYVMIAITVGSCLVMVILGKRAAGRHESLTGQNMERKARWRQEAEKEAALALPQKGQ